MLPSAACPRPRARPRSTAPTASSSTAPTCSTASARGPAAPRRPRRSSGGSAARCPMTDRDRPRVRRHRPRGLRAPRPEDARPLLGPADGRRRDPRPRRRGRRSRAAGPRRPTGCSWSPTTAGCATTSRRRVPAPRPLQWFIGRLDVPAPPGRPPGQRAAPSIGAGRPRRRRDGAPGQDRGGPGRRGRRPGRRSQAAGSPAAARPPRPGRRTRSRATSATRGPGA